MDFLLHFDERIETVNPGASQLLKENGVDPVDVAYILSDALPNIISTDFNPNGSSRQIQASLGDLADQMRHAKPIATSITKEEWLEKRRAASGGHEMKPHGQGQGLGATGSIAAQTLADIPSTVPELPGALLVRPDLIAEIKSELLNETGSTTAALTSKKAKHKSSVHGMGGVGKTTVAIKVVYDDKVRAAFEKILWASVGQDPDVRELLGSLMKQINKQTLKPDLSDQQALAGVKKAAKGLKCLLVLDDVVSEHSTQHEPAHMPCASGARLTYHTRIVGRQVRKSFEFDRSGHTIEAHGNDPDPGTDQGRKRGGHRHPLPTRRAAASSSYGRSRGVLAAGGGKNRGGRSIPLSLRGGGTLWPSRIDGFDLRPRLSFTL